MYVEGCQAVNEIANHFFLGKENTMNIKSIISKVWKSEKTEMPVGEFFVDEVLTVHVQGVAKQCERETDVPPTVSIPLITTLALFWEKSGVTRDAALKMLREALVEAMDKNVKEDDDIAKRIKDKEKAIKAIKKELIGQLPTMDRAGKFIANELSVTILESKESKVA